eukprot:TRINITY_DN66181_c4_g1_i1.p2 TRINITY_DN66181_c4_g1~~TRINITY_DN66181_c4_g1_i1.p2  ORF type:complete len:661 (-),score=337.21 TRINITY_DN66181_c4_g1_i1:41-1867(-)
MSEEEKKDGVVPAVSTVDLLEEHDDREIRFLDNDSPCCCCVCAPWTCCSYSLGWLFFFVLKMVDYVFLMLRWVLTLVYFVLWFFLYYIWKRLLFCFRWGREKDPGPCIGIVGAGPAGLSMAEILRERGFADVTLLERTHRVGGKSVSIKYEGLVHEMGTCYVAAGYTFLIGWFRRHGIELYRLPQHTLLRKDNKTTISFKRFVLGKNLGEFISAYMQTLKYFTLWMWQYHLPLSLGIRKQAFNDNMSMSFEAWLDRHNLPAVKRFCLRAITVMGYGPLYDVPALHGLRWCVPSLLISGAAYIILEPVQGWNSIWQAMAWTHDVRLETEILEIERRANPPPGERAIKVTTRHRRRYHLPSPYISEEGPTGEKLCDEECKEERIKEYQFDHIVITTPLDELEEMMSMTDEEKAIRDAVKWRRFFSTVSHIEGWYNAPATYNIEDTLLHDVDDGHLVGLRRTADKTPTTAARSDTRKRVYVTYQYGTRHNRGELIKILHKDVERLSKCEGKNGHIVKVIKAHMWKYMPTCSFEAIKNGIQFDMMELQGKNRTWWTGATFSHEAVDNIVDYNQWLAQNMEEEFRGFKDWIWIRRVARKANRWFHSLLTLHNK